MDYFQRARLLAAMCDVAAECGLTGATVARVIARAGVSRRTFYEQFANREQCFSAAFGDSVERASACVLPVYRSGGCWLDRLRAGVAALLAFLDRDRYAALLLIGSLATERCTLEPRLRVIDLLVAAVDEGRDEPKANRNMPALAGEGVVGGALSILHARAVRGEEPLTPLQGQLMSMIVMPYLGSAAALQELARPSPPVAGVPEAGWSVDALRKSGVRLTYRTMQVLQHLAQQPGCSNRQAGDAAGIHDPGQISKLLSRLQHLGLIENTGGPPGKGAPNAWALTGRGREIGRAIGRQAATR